MISLDGVEVTYGSTTVLGKVSLRIESGEAVAIVGESGAGKTTMARVLLGLLRPSTGSYSFDDIDVATLRGKSLREWRHRIQAVLQNPTASLNPRVRIDVSVTEPLTAIRRMSRAETRAKAEELLEGVGLDAALAGRYPGQLSGGQRQRVVIARALSVNPDTILLDEPVSALDASARAQVLNLLADLRSTTGATTVYISHDLATVGYLCDRVVVLYGGVVMEDLPIERLHTGPDNPYTQALRNASLSPTSADESPPDVIDAEHPPAAHSPDEAYPEHHCPFVAQCPNAQEVCRTSLPQLVRLDETWWSRCHFAGVPKGSDSQRNTEPKPYKEIDSRV